MTGTPAVIGLASLTLLTALASLPVATPLARARKRPGELRSRTLYQP